MKPALNLRHLLVLALLGGAGASAWLGAQPAAPAETGAPALQPLVEGGKGPELALLMGTLQTYTHKLALAADAGNAPLAAFYLHESMEQLRTIQQEAPDYEGLPIAVLIERLALPSFAELEKTVAGDPAAAGVRERMLAGLDRVVATCNECHTATQHGFIRITRGTEVNPFNQSFQP